MITELRERLAEVLSKHDPFTVSRRPANPYRRQAAELEWECSCERAPVPVGSNEEGDAMSYGHLVDVQLPIIAEWLRQKAAETRGAADVLPATDEREAVGAAKMLDALADGLAVAPANH